jgi:hypothetical protein
MERKSGEGNARIADHDPPYSSERHGGIDMRAVAAWSNKSRARTPKRPQSTTEHRQAPASTSNTGKTDQHRHAPAACRNNWIYHILSGNVEGAIGTLAYSACIPT